MTTQKSFYKRIASAVVGAFDAAGAALVRAEQAFFARGHATWQRICAEPVIVLAVIAFSVIAYNYPVKAGLALWGIFKLTMFARLGLWIFAKLHPNDAPEKLQGIEKGTAWKIRAAYVCVAMGCGALLP